MKQIIIIALSFLVLSSFVLYFNLKASEIPNYTPKTFSSYDELKNFLVAHIGSGYGFGYFSARSGVEIMATAESGTPSGSGSKSVDYSTTNIQVEGVDEADIVKTDGKYIYVVSGKKVVILDGYPAEEANIISEIEFKGTLNEIFINNNKLTVFGSEKETFINIFDVSDKENPILVRNISSEGYYYDSRMIGDYVYAIINQPIYYHTGEVPLPAIELNGNVKEIPATEIYYFDIYDYSYQYTNILAINTQDNNKEITTKVYLIGATQNIYVSMDNIYITYTKRVSEIEFYDRVIDEVIIPVVPSDIKNEINRVREMNITEYEKWREVEEIFEDYVDTLSPEDAANFMKSIERRMDDLYKQIAKEMEKTVIHKISVNNENVEYKTNGEVPGYILNQFSMDEYNEHFRIATTTGNWRSDTLNHVYVLNPDLKIVGKLEDLAEGERIYSVRFIGGKAYMVTFRQIDPLFVIDLSNPSKPEVLGYLKIPGVSDYLHPYDENHIIGVGRDATEEGRMLGMKLSLFDVTDVSNPTEISKYIIGERGTTSDILYDHKAFLFSKSKNLLVIPASVSEGGNWNAFQGDYVFNLDLENGFVLKGRITHSNETTNETRYYYDYSSQIRRSFYIDDVLYTISNKMIKMNSLENLDEINKINLPYEEYYYPIWGWE